MRAARLTAAPITVSSPSDWPPMMTGPVLMPTRTVKPCDAEALLHLLRVGLRFLQDGQPGPDRHLRVVLARDGMAEQRLEAVAHVARHPAAEGCARARTGA